MTITAWSAAGGMRSAITFTISTRKRPIAISSSLSIRSSMFPWPTQNRSIAPANCVIRKRPKAGTTTQPQKQTVNAATAALAVDLSSRMNRFSHRLATDGSRLRRSRTEILQVNVGKLCNLTCVHCHVNAGPKRKEIMAQETVDRIVNWLAKTDIPTVDLTGGAPELIPDFRYFIERVKALEPSRHVIDRCKTSLRSITNTNSKNISESCLISFMHSRICRSAALRVISGITVNWRSTYNCSLTRLIQQQLAD